MRIEKVEYKTEDGKVISSILGECTTGISPTSFGGEGFLFRIHYKEKNKLPFLSALTEIKDGSFQIHITLESGGTIILKTCEISELESPLPGLYREKSPTNEYFFVLTRVWYEIK